MTDDPSSPSEVSTDHPRRQAIVEAVRTSPGLNWNQLQRTTGMPVGALLFHLERLEREGAVVRRDSTNQNEVLFFTPETVELWRNPRTRLLFGNEATRRVAAEIALHPGTAAGEIAERLGVHPVTVRYHLGKLSDHGLIAGFREGRAIQYRPTDELRAWVDRFGEPERP